MTCKLCRNFRGSQGLGPDWSYCLPARYPQPTIHRMATGMVPELAFRAGPACFKQRHGPLVQPSGEGRAMQTFETVWRFNSAREGQLVGVGPLFWGDRSASEPGGGDDHAPSRMCIKLLSSSRAQERYPSVPQPCSQLWQGLWSCAREAPPTGGLLLSPPTPRTASALRGLSPLARPASSARQGGAGLSTCSCPSLPTPLSREPLPVALGTGRDVDAAGPGASASGLCVGLMPT